MTEFCPHTVIKKDHSAALPFVRCGGSSGVPNPQKGAHHLPSCCSGFAQLMFATRPRSTALPVRGHENPPVAPHNQAPHTSRCWQQCSRLFPPFFSSSNLSNPRYSWTVEERWVAGQNGHHPAPALADFVARGRGCFTTSATLPSAMDEAQAQMTHTTANITKLWEGTFKTFIINLHRRLLPPLCASVPSGGSCLQTHPLPNPSVPPVFSCACRFARLGIAADPTERLHAHLGLRRVRRGH